MSNYARLKIPPKTETVLSYRGDFESAKVTEKLAKIPLFFRDYGQGVMVCIPNHHDRDAPPAVYVTRHYPVTIRRPIVRELEGYIAAEIKSTENPKPLEVFGIVVTTGSAFLSVWYALYGMILLVVGTASTIGPSLFDLCVNRHKAAAFTFLFSRDGEAPPVGELV